jgi:hypothetical protein
MVGRAEPMLCHEAAEKRRNFFPALTLQIKLNAKIPEEESVPGGQQEAGDSNDQPMF